MSGHVKFRDLVEALSRKYCVRAIVRRAEQGQQLKDASTVKPYGGNLEIVVVKDLLKPGAFDGVLDGAAGVPHIASPLAITVRFGIFHLLSQNTN